MRFLGFGGRVGPKRFNYIPQHYDEQAERLNNLMEEMDPNDEGGIEAMKARVKHSLSYRPYYYDRNHTASKERKKANIRTLIITGILFGIVLYILTMYSEDITGLAK